jgi:hypothetical protein
VRIKSMENVARSGSFSRRPNGPHDAGGRRDDLSSRRAQVSRRVNSRPAAGLAAKRVVPVAGCRHWTHGLRILFGRRPPEIGSGRISSPQAAVRGISLPPTDGPRPPSRRRFSRNSRSTIAIRRSTTLGPPPASRATRPLRWTRKPPPIARRAVVNPRVFVPSASASRPGCRT